MRLASIGRLAVAGLAAIVIVAGIPRVAVVRAQDAEPFTPVALPLPAAVGLAADAALEVADEPAPLPQQLDFGPVVDAGYLAYAAMDPADWVLDDLALGLQLDVAAAFRFVRDEVALDPYAGVLRGAEGTLAARAGNAWDRALLLQALLDRMLIPTRLAVADLDAASVERLFARSFADPPVAAPSLPRALVVADPAAIGARARRDHALLRESLGSRLDGLGVPAEADARAALASHAWVQALIGSEWVDLDPSLPESEPGVALAAASETFATPPDAQRHTVALTLTVTQLDGGALTDQAVLERTVDAAAAARSTAYLYFQPLGDGLGGSIVRAFSGDIEWVPVMLVDGAGEAGTAFRAGGRGTDLFGEPTNAPELARIVLTIRTDGPGLEPRTAERVLLDRLPPGARDASGGPVALTPEDLAPLPDGAEVPDALAMIHHVIVSTGAADPFEGARQRVEAVPFAQRLLADPASVTEYALGDLLRPMSAADDAVTLAAERVIVGGLDADPAIRALIDRPRVYLSTVGPDARTGGSVAIIDLALDGIRVIAPDGLDPADAARHQLWYGTLQSALETELTLQRARTRDPADRRIVAVSLAMDRPLSVLGPADAPDLPGTASPALRAALAGGDLAVVLGDPSTSGLHWSVAPTGFVQAIGHGLRIGFDGGGNYVNGGGFPSSYDIVDPNTGRVIGKVVNGRDVLFKRPAPPPPSRCSGGQEYVLILGCVSVPGAVALAMNVGIVVVGVAVAVTIIFFIGYGILG
jgi:hypothetical protein